MENTDSLASPYAQGKRTDPFLSPGAASFTPPIYADLLESDRYRWQMAIRSTVATQSTPTRSHLGPLVEQRRLALCQEFQDTFSDRPLQAFPDPAQMLNAERAAKRVASALVNDEPVVIVGDYDVDGTVSCSMLRRFLNSLPTRKFSKPVLRLLTF